MPSINNSITDFSEHIHQHIANSINTISLIKKELNEPIYKAVNKLIETFKNGNKILVAGNGGSAADAQHFAAEFIVRLTAKKTRKSLPAISLSTDTSILTAASNDFGFDLVYKRQLEGLGKPGDCFIVLSTSGNSKNLVEALEFATKNKIHTIGLLGNNGGAMQNLVDIAITVRSNKTMHIQEAHICIYHLICDLVEQCMF